MRKKPTCDKPCPKNEKLGCMKEPGHKKAHAVCLGFHPEPHNQFEWCEWEDGNDEVKVWQQ